MIVLQYRYDYYATVVGIISREGHLCELHLLRGAAVGSAALGDHVRRLGVCVTILLF